MTSSVKYYKIKLIKELVDEVDKARQQLMSELIVNATDPVILNRRIRMLKHLNLYENQLINKIQNFQTDNVNDLIKFDYSIKIETIINRSA